MPFADKEKKRAYMAAYARANHRRILARQRARYLIRRDEITRKQRELRRKYPERYKEIAARYYQRNKLKAAIRVSRRRASFSGEHTIEQIAELLVRQRYKCAVCGVSIRHRYERDHITPLSKHGTDEITNIQLLCGPCNRRKHNHDPIEFMQSVGRLL